jgi:dTMP kinase
VSVAEEIRQIVLDPNIPLSPEAQIELFTAARRVYTEKLVKPALADGKFVIADRGIMSTRVLQTFGDTNAELRQLIDRLHASVVQLEPSLTIILDVSIQTAQARMRERAGSPVDRFETISGMLAHEHHTYRALAEEFSHSTVLVDGTGEVEAVAAKVWGAFTNRYDLSEYQAEPQQ